MLPKMPPSGGEFGFLFAPPFRIQGVSVAGEQTCVQIPELDVAFDIGLCPRTALASPYVAISHGHMDHIGALAYYFSQRIFQGMDTGKCVCHARIAGAIANMMRGYVELEDHPTPHEIIGLSDGEQIEIKNNIFLRALEVSHTVPSLGYAVVEKRSKLREEFRDKPQSELKDLKNRGVEITQTLEIPLVAYTGDTELGPFLFRDEFAKARVVICECTFFEAEHRSRAKVGKHLHVDDLRMLLGVWEAPMVVLVHVSRRTNLAVAREEIRNMVGEARAERVHFLMDHRANRARYEKQRIDAGEAPTMRPARATR